MHADGVELYGLTDVRIPSMITIITYKDDDMENVAFWSTIRMEHQES